MTLVVDTVDGQFQIAPEDIFTFGRSDSCTFCVDDTDRNISRKAGTIRFNGEHWMLTNSSSNRNLRLTDHRSGSMHNLLPGHAFAICEQRIIVSMYGSNRSVFQFTVITPQLNAAPNDLRITDTSATLGPPNLSPRQCQDLRALFRDNFEPDSQRSPKPMTYAEAAILIGDTGKALEHRISNFRGSLLKSGYPRMSLDELAIFLIGTGALTPENAAPCISDDPQ